MYEKISGVLGHVPTNRGDTRVGHVCRRRHRVRHPCSSSVPLVFGFEAWSAVEFETGKLSVRTRPSQCSSGRLGWISTSPYPNGDWKCIVEVRFETDLCLGRLKERDPRFGPEQQYIVTFEKTILCTLSIVDGNKKHPIKVPRGLVTDFGIGAETNSAHSSDVSGLILRRRLFTIIQWDWFLYVAWQIHGLTPTDDMRRFSDKAMLEAMLESGMGCKAYIIYGAVRLLARRLRLL